MITDVLAKNLDYLRERAELLEDVRIGLYHEAALAVRNESDFPPAADDLPRIYAEIRGNTEGGIVSGDFARFCLEFAEVFGAELGEIFPDERESGVTAPRIAYLQNAFSDRAYRIFSSALEEETYRVSALYFPGFREVCEEVYYGRCTHAMLPIFSTSDGQLVSFRKLIAKYDLKIKYITDVEISEDSAMRFALLQKGLDDLTAREELPRYLDLAVVPTENWICGAFLSSCELLGAKVLMVNSHPLEYADDRFALDVQLDISEANTRALYLFLEGSHIRYDTVGIYDML